MKTITVKYLAVFTICILAAACAPMAQHTSANKGLENVNHAALTKYHENLARTMQSKAEEQKQIVKNRSRVRKFGRNAQLSRNRVIWRINKYEKEAELNFAKAAYHKKIAQEQASHDRYSKPGATKQIDKARIRQEKGVPSRADDFHDAL
ncbi:hypothetical protein SAMN05216326_1189 [Nitrosomonas marina]|uniref:Lipoprotein n=1 Tax=Nitrosomonas marina TaxID=917 RepID=A0A1I0D341_9PROT|nr:hypothetical protein [Nitrosomonas marina]SET26629.1 hypothetical protein SAMN05216326_1189 [Nitrosomonas marina]